MFLGAAKTGYIWAIILQNIYEKHKFISYKVEKVEFYCNMKKYALRPVILRKRTLSAIELGNLTRKEHACDKITFRATRTVPLKMRTPGTRTTREILIQKGGIKTIQYFSSKSDFFTLVSHKKYMSNLIVYMY